jgi:hypothetical protein
MDAELVGMIVTVLYTLWGQYMLVPNCSPGCQVLLKQADWQRCKINLFTDKPREPVEVSRKYVRWDVMCSEISLTPSKH